LTASTEAWEPRAVIGGGTTSPASGKPTALGHQRGTGAGPRSGVAGRPRHDRSLDAPG